MTPLHNSPEKRIDFAAVRSLIGIDEVLSRLSWEPTSTRGPQLRGPCPLPSCPSTSPRTFCVQLEKHCWRCFTCGRHGNHLDLWAILTGQNLYHAAIHLCHQAGKPVPQRPPTPVSASQTLSTGPQ